MCTAGRQSVPLTKLDLDGRDHTLVVPYEVQHQVTVHSKKSVVKDNGNRDVDNSRPLPSSASKEKKPQDIVIQVDRVKP